MARKTCLLLLVILFSACATVSKTGDVSQGDHFATINGVKLHYKVAGNGPVCIVHPGGPGFNLDYLRMPELEKHLTLVYLDPVGAGKSDRLKNREGYTLDRYTRDLEGLRIHLNLEKFFLIGHSSGGFVAQLYSLKHQDRLNGLILIGSSPVATNEWMGDMFSNMKLYGKQPWYPEAVANFSTAFASKSDAEITAKFRKCYGFYVYDYTSDKRRTDAALSILNISLMPLLTGFTQEFPKFDVRHRLYEIKVPTLVVVGWEDVITSLQFSRMLNEGIPGSKLVIIEKSGHFTHFDKPEELAAAIGDFVISQNK